MEPLAVPTIASPQNPFLGEILLRYTTIAMATAALPPKGPSTGDAAATDNPEDDNYVEYIPVKKHLAMEPQRILQCKRCLASSSSADAGGGSSGHPSTTDDDPDRPLLVPEAKPSLLI